jgi:two-component system LytT family response regulator
MKVLVIDDERLARQELKKLLKKHQEIEIIGEAANADEANELIQEKKPDLIFLDIQMPGKTGFELLEELDEVPLVIFVTAYDEYAIEAFKVNALDYLLKPVEPKLLSAAIDKVFSMQHNDNKTIEHVNKLTSESQIFLKDGDKCWFVSLKDVRMFESEGNYVRVFFNNYKPLILKSLNNLEKKLDEETFFRANRKFIINLKWIESIENWFSGGLLVKLKGGETVEVSRRQAARFKDMMSL